MFEFEVPVIELVIAGFSLPLMIFLTVEALKAFGLIDADNAIQKRRANLLVGFGLAVVGVSYTIFPQIKPIADVIISWLYGSIIAALFYNVKEAVVKRE
jgi:hypothetical protein